MAQPQSYPVSYVVLMETFRLGLIDKDECRELLTANHYLPERISGAPYQLQSGTLTRVVADLKAKGMSMQQVKEFFEMVVDAKYQDAE